ncbi:Oxidoreductase, short chain dehydrogenase/reductase family [Labilithrix luteola]|uniref:Oxidoreductase, short chain dehydrogenase/reductase family n=1 Tax=Labilithrix luteola TaxID=1391654 RepID=A0A0K1PQK3_9BACT|nr:SDR family oxidoreductase [Labilithrix luteola]AKU95802.1 Oxidoreductase, short chain dehydrogenase/reductase family [Labilithrix luteola]
MTITFDPTHWALVLGGSSGFGLATALKLARHGMNVCVVHRDRRGAMEAIEPRFEELRSLCAGFLAVNTDALSDAGRATVLDALSEKMGVSGRVRLLMHSVAYGNLKPLATAHDEPVLEGEDFARTVHAMGTSLATWTQDILARGMFAGDARVIAMTSEGNEVAWRGYAAVAAAKCALESVSRAIAVELGPRGIRSNVLQAGVTDTPALRLIPGSERMKAHALERNPLGRLTTPSDVADLVCLLCTDEARWVNGALIRVDGGERIAG